MSRSPVKGYYGRHSWHKDRVLNALWDLCFLGINPNTRTRLGPEGELRYVTRRGVSDYARMDGNTVRKILQRFYAAGLVEARGVISWSSGRGPLVYAPTELLHPYMEALRGPIPPLTTPDPVTCILATEPAERPKQPEDKRTRSKAKTPPGDLDYGYETPKKDSLVEALWDLSVLGIDPKTCNEPDHPPAEHVFVSARACASYIGINLRTAKDNLRRFAEVGLVEQSCDADTSTMLYRPKPALYRRLAKYDRGTTPRLPE